MMLIFLFFFLFCFVSAETLNHCENLHDGGVVERKFKEKHLFSLRWRQSCSRQSTVFELKGIYDSNEMLSIGFESINENTNANKIDYYSFYCDGTYFNQHLPLSSSDNNKLIDSLVDNTQQCFESPPNIVCDASGHMSVQFHRQWLTCDNEMNVDLTKPVRLRIVRSKPIQSIMNRLFQNDKRLEYETLNTPINMLAQDPCLTQSIITNTFTTTLGNDDFDIDYKLDCKQKLATFTLTTNTAGWIAIGFNTHHTMPGADLYQANLVNAHAAAQNSVALNGDVYPHVNQSMIHGTPTASRNASMFTATFTRRFDALNNQIGLSLSFATPLYLLVARCNVSDFSFGHVADASGRWISDKPVQLFTTQPPGPTPPPSPHSECEKHPSGSLLVKNPFVHQNGTPSTDISIKWLHNCVNETTTIHLEGKSLGWIGMGLVPLDKIDPSAAMNHGEFYMFYVDINGTSHATNRHGIGNTKPVPDSVEDFVTTPIVSRINNTLKAVFERPWKAINNGSDEHHAIDNGAMRLMVARGLEASFSNWHHSQRAVSPNNIDFFKATPTPTPSPTHFNCTQVEYGVLEVGNPFPALNGTPVANIELKWHHDCAHQTTTFTLRGHTLGWLGMGIIQPSKMIPGELMKGAEFYMFYVDVNGTAQYTNRYGIGNTKPAVSDHEDFVAGTPNVTYVGTELTVQFTRPWGDIDATGQHTPLNQGPLALLVARGTARSFSNYHHSQKALVKTPLDLKLQHNTPSPAPVPHGNECQRHPTGSRFVPEPWPVAKGMPPSNFWIGWQHHCANRSTTFEVRAHSPGWIAFGLIEPSKFNSGEAMKGADFYMFAIDNSTGAFVNKHGIGNTRPANDSTQAFIGTPIVQVSSGELSVTFERAWAAVDAEHTPLDQGPLQLLVARAAKPDFNTYHHTQRAVVQEHLDLRLTKSHVPPSDNHNCTANRDGHRLWFLPFPEHPQLPNTNYWLGWHHNCENMTTKFTLVAHSLGWLGLGFLLPEFIDTNEYMKGADFYMFYETDNGTLGYTNRHGIGNHSPKPDKKESFVGVPTISKIGTSFIIEFERIWSALDDQHVPLNAGDLKIIAARGEMSGSKYSYHKDQRAILKGTIDLHLPTDCALFNDGTLTYDDVYASSPNSSVVLSYRHDCDQRTTEFNLTNPSSGWFGVGFKEAEQAVVVDLYMFAQNGNQTTYANRHWVNGSVPSRDAAQAFEAQPRVNTVNGTLQATFVRPWAAIDATGQHVALNRGPLRLVAARSNASDFDSVHYERRVLNGTVEFRLPPEPSCSLFHTGNTTVVDPFPHNNTKQAPTDYFVGWEHHCVLRQTTFTLHARTTGWLGFGVILPENVTQNAKMTGGDFYMFYMDSNGTSHYTNRHGVGNTRPAKDTTQNFVATPSVIQINGALTAVFTRSWDRVDATDQHVELNGGPLQFMLARGEEPSFDNYHHNQRYFAPKLLNLHIPKSPSPPLPPPPPTHSPAPTKQTGGNPCDTVAHFSNNLTMTLGTGANAVVVDIRYTIDCKAETIEFTLSCTTLGWLAIGFNEAPTMGGADVYQAMLDEKGAPHARNGDAVRGDVNQYADQSMLIGAPHGIRNGTQLTMTFKRHLKKRKDAGRTLSYEHPLYLMVSHCDTKDFTFGHATDVFGRGATKQRIQLFSDKQIKPQTVRDYRGLVVIHGGLMLFAWVFLSNIGVFIARYLKDVGHKWYVTHRAIMIGVVSISIAALVLSFYYTEHKGESHFVMMGWNPHKIIGIVLIGLALLQPLLGIAANRMYIVNRFETPIFPDKVHWWLGRLLLLLGSGNSFLGLVLLAATEPIIRSSTMVFFGCVVLIVIFFLCGQFLLGVRHHNNDTDMSAADDLSPLLGVNSHRSSHSIKLNRFFSLSLVMIVVGVAASAAVVGIDWMGTQ